ncbi:hypothetical protein H0Z60_04440 [Ectothiorhodospiraceae bacterium WFHF3C12]|nr:hypothetical protein [Ectothiorhodospiraceae bacterium WFHF3C12]
MSQGVRRLAGLLLLSAVMALGGCAVLGRGDTPSAVAEILGPEAIVMSRDGRVFITGRSGVYELRDPEGAPRLEQLPVRANVPAGCQFTGAESWERWLFVVCTVGDGSYLLRAQIGSNVPVLGGAAALPDIAIASGLTADDRGTLYVADSRQGGAAITRVTGATSSAFELETEVWLQDTRGGFPNGLQYASGRLYLTSAGRLSAIDLDERGRPGEIRTITTRLTFLDDFRVLPGGGFLLTDYSFNRLIVLSAEGIEMGTLAHGLQGPTDVLLLPAAEPGVPSVLIAERDRERISRVDPPESLQRFLMAPASNAR